MPRSQMPALIAAFGVAMLALVPLVRGDLIWMTLVAAAAAIGLSAYLGQRPTRLSKQHVIDLLNGHGYTQPSEEASRELPDPVYVDQMSAWLIQHGVGFLRRRRRRQGDLMVLKKPVGWLTSRGGRGHARIRSRQRSSRGPH